MGIKSPMDDTKLKENDTGVKKDEVKYRGIKAMPFIIGNKFICDLYIEFC